MREPQSLPLNHILLLYPVVLLLCPVFNMKQSYQVKCNIERDVERDDSSFRACLCTLLLFLALFGIISIFLWRFQEISSYHQVKLCMSLSFTFFLTLFSTATFYYCSKSCVCRELDLYDVNQSSKYIRKLSE